MIYKVKQSKHFNELTCWKLDGRQSNQLAAFNQSRTTLVLNSLSKTIIDIGFINEFAREFVLKEKNINKKFT